MGLFPDPPLTPKLKNKLFRSSSNRKAIKSSATAIASDKNCTNSSSSDFVTVTTAHQLSTSWEFIRSASSDNETVKKSPTDSNFPPHYTEIYNVNQETVCAGTFLPQRYIEVCKGRIILETKKKDSNDEIDCNTFSSQHRLPDSLDDDYAHSIIVQSNPETSTHENRNMRTFTAKKPKQLKMPTLETIICKPLAMTDKKLSTHHCCEHENIQACFKRQEESLLILKHENKSLRQRVEQYEACLDDIMRKVVDALVAEDNLREEVSILKNRVKDLEAQNAILIASPSRCRDEGYCTMSSDLPQFPSKSLLEELPEEPEQWLAAAEPCSAEIEDWSLSLDELATTLEVDGERIWNSNFLTTISAQSDDVTSLLQEPLMYSDDEEMACTNFTRDFYRLVSIKSDSNQSLQSPVTVETTSSSNSNNDRHERLINEDHSIEVSNLAFVKSTDATVQHIKLPLLETTSLSPVKLDTQQQEVNCHRAPTIANGWKRIPRNNQETFIPVLIKSKDHDRPKSSPPVPVRRHLTTFDL